MENNLTESPISKILKEYLKENKLRCTPERFKILNMIYSIDGSFDIDTLLLHMEEKKFRVSRATVYNTITLLINANLVTHHQFGNKSRYEKSLNNEMARYCGYCTLSNLFREGAELDDNEQKEYMTAIKATLHTPGDTTTLQNSASISLIKFSEQKSGLAAEACKEIKSWGIEERPALQQLVANIEEGL